MTRTPAAPATAEPLDKSSFIPLYFQIQQKLMERIQTGDLTEGDLLESEEDLSRRFQVSRMTARQALRGLKDQGYAYSVKGRGTFVCRPKMEKNILHLQGFTEEMRQQGLQPSSQLLEQAVIPANEEMARRLNLQPNETVLRLLRLRFADGDPIALETSHVSLGVFRGLERFDFGKRSLYQTLRERFGVRVGWADEVIEAMAAGRDEARLLTIAPKASLLCITRTVVTAQGVPIEFARSLYRADRYRAVIRVPATTIE